MKSADYWVDEIDDIFMNTSRNMQWPRVREVRALVEAIREEFRKEAIEAIKKQPSVIPSAFSSYELWQLGNNIYVALKDIRAALEKLGKEEEK